MKTKRIYLSLLLAGSFSQACLGKVLLLGSHEGQDRLFAVSKTEAQQVLALGSQVIYGESATQLAILSRKPSRAEEFELDVIDKSSNKLCATWSIKSHVISWLEGPLPQIVLTNDAAYFVTGYQDASSPYQLNRIDLKTGSQKTSPLPSGVNNPKLLLMGPDIILYSWNGSGVWSYSLAADSFRELVPAELSSTASAVGSESKNTAQLVSVDGLGVFRLTTGGEVETLLDAGMGLIPKTTSSKASEKFSQIFPVQVGNTWLIAALKTTKENKVFVVYLDPATLQERASGVSNVAVPPQALISNHGDAIYVDPKGETIVRSSADGETSIVASLRDHVAPLTAKILTLIPE